jgi:predicted N-acetyltransferase YhbS
MDGERSDLTIRTLSQGDLNRLVRMDEQHTGRRRQAWYEGKLARALAESDVQISLGVEMDGVLVGAVLGSLHYGEFGQPEPSAVLDTVLVDREYHRRGVAAALLSQLVKNLNAFHIERLRTEVAWDEHGLVSFFARMGFTPVPRLVLELDIPRAEKDLRTE